MKRRLLFVICLIFMFCAIPYMITTVMSGAKTKVSVDLDTYDSGYSVTVSGTPVDMERYIAGILPTTISLDKQEEALKAQAVILRTQILKKMQQAKSIDEERLPYTYKSNKELKQILGDQAYELKNVKREKAVVDTLGKAITYDGTWIDAYYHEISVGTTLDSKEWFQKEIPYIKEKSAYIDTESDDYIESKEFTYGEVVEKLEKSFQIKITTKEAEDTLATPIATKSGYVKEVKAGKEKILGTQFAKCFGLPSTNFYFEHYDGKFRILSLGRGSGLGMSQNMANEMAKKKKTYKQILKYFFPNTKIKSFRE